MRTHGAPFWPDPVILSSGVYDAPVGYPISVRILDQEQGPGWQAAVTACQRLAPAGLAPEALPLTEQQITSLRSELAKLAACMRSHGIAGFPSPWSALPAAASRARAPGSTRIPRRSGPRSRPRRYTRGLSCMRAACSHTARLSSPILSWDPGAR